MASIYRHALKNAMIPVVSIVGLQFAGLLGGAVIVETVFGWPGIGRLAVDAIFNRDIPVIQAVVLVAAVISVFVNLLVDLRPSRPADPIRVRRPARGGLS